jgi:hypothetical protein
LKKNNFLLDTDWIFQGYVDMEHKKYVLLSFFQKLNKNLEEIKIYPIFTEISLHLGNIQTLIKKNKILYIDKELTTDGDEISLDDLKFKEIPKLNKEEYDEFQNILTYSQPKLFDYFQILKSLWSVVYDKIDINVVKNKNNLKSRFGFFYFKKNGILYIWKYTKRKTKGEINFNKSSFELLYEDKISNKKIEEIISTVSPKYVEKNENKFPIFEIVCNEDLPLNETLLPISKRKVLIKTT